VKTFFTSVATFLSQLSINCHQHNYLMVFININYMTLMQDIPLCFQNNIWHTNWQSNTAVFITIYNLRATCFDSFESSSGPSMNRNKTIYWLDSLGSDHWRAWWWLEGVETCSPEVVDCNKNCCVWLSIWMSYIINSMAACFDQKLVIFRPVRNINIKLQYANSFYGKTEISVFRVSHVLVSSKI
jgi:hypothetical protein